MTIRAGRPAPPAVRRRVAALVGLAVLAAGCAGPRAHVTLGGKNEPLNVAFGKPTTVNASAPLAPVPSGLGVLPVAQDNPGHQRVIVRYVTVPAKDVPLPPLPPPPVCPKADPFAAPKQVAGDSVTTTVPTGTFQYRYHGRSVEGRTVRDMSGLSPHAVTGSAVGNGSYRFTIDVNMGGAKTSYSYLSVPGVSTAQNVSGGIELVQVTGTGGFGYQASFHPDKPLQVFSQPAYTGEAWHDAESDVQSGSVATIDGTVGGKDRVDACGAVLDAWKTTAVMKITSPNESIQTTVSTWWATQFGGLPIQETQTYTGTAGGKPVKGVLTSVITVNPAKAKKS